MQTSHLAQPEIKGKNSEAESLSFESSELFLLNRTSTKRIVMNEGGVRSGKTMAIIDTLISEFQESEGPLKIEIVRETMPSLRATAMEDFLDRMRELQIYEEKKHNKTENIYRDGNKTISFFPVDDEQKIRGRKRDILWINEANELDYDEFKQLALRTKKRIYLDFNPPEEDHWLVEKVMPRDDVEYIHSDYRCNPFLAPEIVSEIEMMQEGDEQYWRVFGLGERPIKGTIIYSHHQLVDDLPENLDEEIYGIDFGFNVQSAIVKIGLKENARYWDELLYKTHLTNQDLIEELKALRDAGLITESMQGYADAAEPDRIQEINDAGFNVKPADKAVKAGIDYSKARPMYITKRSINILEERKFYSWKTDKDGKVLDEPVKKKDHAMDAGRYAVFTHGKELMGGSPNIRLL